MKRFTETDKWKDVWFRRLAPIEKLTFLYLVDNCDNAGFLELDQEMMARFIGITELDLEGALKGLVRGIEGASGWVWVKNFLRHQKNDVLNPDNPAHRQIIGLLEKQRNRFGHVAEFAFLTAKEGASKGHKSPIGKGTGKGERKSAEKESDVEWLQALSESEAYRGIDVAREHAKAAAWIRERPERRFTRPFFMKWLNKCEPTLTAPVNGHSKPGYLEV